MFYKIWFNNEDGFDLIIMLDCQLNNSRSTSSDFT